MARSIHDYRRLLKEKEEEILFLRAVIVNLTTAQIVEEEENEADLTVEERDALCSWILRDIDI